MKVNMCVYLRAKFEVPSSIILMSFNWGVSLPPSHIKKEPLKSPPRSGLSTFVSLFSKRQIPFFHQLLGILITSVMPILPPNLSLTSMLVSFYFAL